MFPGQKGRNSGAFSILKIQVLSREEISMFSAEEEVGSSIWHSWRQQVKDLKKQL